MNSDVPISQNITFDPPFYSTMYNAIHMGHIQRQQLCSLVIIVIITSLIFELIRKVCLNSNIILHTRFWLSLNDSI